MRGGPLWLSGAMVWSETRDYDALRNKRVRVHYANHSNLKVMHFQAPHMLVGIRPKSSLYSKGRDFEPLFSLPFSTRYINYRP